MTLDARKAAARKAAFARRKAAWSAGQPAAATQHLLRALEPHRGKPVAGYMPIRSEIDPLPALSEIAGFGPVCLPVIVAAGQALKFSRWHPRGTLRDGPFGARVPMIDDFLDPHVLIVPLVAFDRQGGRLGYGGGFYDRSLEKLRAIRPTLAIGFAFAAQEIPTDQALPLEPTDQPLDMIVTDRGVIHVPDRQASSA